MFDYNRHGDARIVIRCIIDEQRMVAPFPWQILVADHAPRAFGGCDVADLTSAGLARHAKAVRDDATSISCATPVIGHFEHRPPDGPHMVFVETQRFGIGHGLFDAVNATDQAWFDLATDRQTRGHHRQMQGRCQHKTLPDRRVDRIANHPVLTKGFPFPLARGCAAACHGGHRQIEAYADAQLLGHCRHGVDADLQGQIVVIDVTAFAQCRFKVHMAMPAAFPAMETAA